MYNDRSSFASDLGLNVQKSCIQTSRLQNGRTHFL